MKIIRYNAFRRFKYDNGLRIPVYDYNVIMSKNGKLVYLNFTGPKDVNVEEIIKNYFG